MRATAKKPLTVVRPKFNLGKILPPKGQPFHLRIAGANQPREEGFLGLDEVKTDSVDYLHKLQQYPWPIDDGVVDRIFSLHYLQKLNGLSRIDFMNSQGL